MYLIVTPLLAATYGLVFCAIALWGIVIQYRYVVRPDTLLESALARAKVAQTSFAGYAPLTLILFGAYEIQGGPLVILTVFALGAVFSRALHAIATCHHQKPLAPRVAATTLNLFIIAVLGCLIILNKVGV